MPIPASAMNTVASPTNPNSESESVELEYHALMGVQGGDEPHFHARSFERSAAAPIGRVRERMVRRKTESSLI